MLVSYKWLQRYVDIDVDPQTLADKLTMAGITVDLVHYPWQHISKIYAGKIREITKHPDADKLVVCQIEMGDYRENLGENGLLQIVTGAPNVAVGQTVPVAVHGATVAGGKIKKSKLRGVPSNGMLCSKGELGVEACPDDVDGIWILPDDIAAGTDLIQELLLDDAVLELDLTPNRSDCLSIINVAREVSAILESELHLPEITYPETTVNVADVAKIIVQDETLCPRYTARVIQNVELGHSPIWMQHFLQTAGIRPISNVVDIGNFVMLEWGQPLHTFDYDTIAGHEIIVRPAKEGETIITLDEQKRQLPEQALLICDAERPVCVAGVMGGLNTEITKETKSILLECAAFQHVSIRHTSKALGLRSESSMRYEKGVNLANLDVVSRRATQLLVELCGGEAAAGLLDSMTKAPEQITVKMRPQKINQLLGTNFAEANMVKVMERLRFPIMKLPQEQEDAFGAAYQVIVPFYRPDVSREVDLAEEVARLLGYDEIPTTLPYGAMTEGKLTGEQHFLDDVVRRMAALGANQAVTYGFISPREWDKLHLPEADPLRHNVEIMNPLNEDQKIMRRSLLPGLLKVAAKNHSRRNQDLFLFEQGAIFIPGTEELPQEDQCLGVLATGKAAGNWLGDGEVYDFFFMKGVWETLCQVYGIKHWHMEAVQEAPYLHPGRAARIYVDDTEVGFLGELHPLVAKEYDLMQKAVVMQINLQTLYPFIKVLPEYHSLPKFPASERDIAITVNRSIPVAEIEQVVREFGGKYLLQVSLFDVYESEQIGKENRSLAYRLTFQCEERTLTDEEVNEAFQAIVDHLAERFEAKLR